MMLRRMLGLTALAVVSFVLFPGCADETTSGLQTVDIMAEDYEFTAPDTISSGWTTLRMHNQGSEHHMFALVRLPDRITYDDFETEVVAPYDSVWSLVVNGTMDRAEAHKRLGSLLPDWYPGQLTMRGGVGLTASSRVGETTVNLKPGTYVLECNVMTSKGEDHALLGMLHRLTVISASSEATPPVADQELTVANLELEGVGPVSAGEHTFAVHFNKDPKSLLLQYLHLARLDDGVGAKDLADWMTSLDPVMPAPTEFLGGPGHMPAGNTAYVTAELEPGRYAWLLGLPAEQGEVETFTVE